MPMRAAHFRGPILALLMLVPSLTPLHAAGEPPAPLDRNDLDERVASRLREIYKFGAEELYNKGYSTAAAYYFQGSLEAVEPLLDHQPVAQRTLRKGLTAAAQIQDIDRRAWKLRDVLIALRDTLERGPDDVFDPHSIILW
jgi:hypothetical protein